MRAALYRCYSAQTSRDRYQITKGSSAAEDLGLVESRKGGFALEREQGCEEEGMPVVGTEAVGRSLVRWARAAFAWLQACGRGCTAPAGADNRYVSRVCFLLARGRVCCSASAQGSANAS